MPTPSRDVIQKAVAELVHIRRHEKGSELTRKEKDACDKIVQTAAVRAERKIGRKRLS